MTNMRNVTIRAATLDDKAALLRLYEQIDEHHRQARPDVFRVPPGDRRSEAFLKKRIENVGCAMYVAQAGEKVVGLATIVLRSNPEHFILKKQHYAEIDEIVVDTGHQQRGTGTLLLEACLDWARRQPDVTAVTLGVHEFNENARRFYENKGFKTFYRQMEIEL